MVSQPNVDGAHTAVIGGSIGSNMALLTGVDQPLINTVALLSPGLDYRGVLTEPEIEAFGNRPVLIVASSEDRYSAQSSQTLADLALHSQSELILYDGAGHGTNMFGGEPSLAQTLIDWLNAHVGP